MMISGNNDAERAQKKASILLLFGKNMQVVIKSSVSFASVGKEQMQSYQK